MLVRFSPSSARVKVQPDLFIGLKPNQLRGSNRYNATGAGQTVREKVTARNRGTFAIRLQDDGYTTYSNMLKAARKNKSHKLRYRSTGGNLTGAIKRGRFQTDVLSGNGDARMKVDVKPTRRGVEK